MFPGSVDDLKTNKQRYKFMKLKKSDADQMIARQDEASNDEVMTENEAFDNELMEEDDRLQKSNRKKTSQQKRGQKVMFIY